MKKKHLLGHVADEITPGMEVQMVKRNIIDIYGACLRMEKPRNQIGNRRLGARQNDQIRLAQILDAIHETHRHIVLCAQWIEIVKVTDVG